jgi:PAS domain S-box-containing protein
VGSSVKSARSGSGESAWPDGEAKYRMLFEHTSDAVIVFDEEGRFLEVNARLCRLLGYEREELLRMNVRDLLPEEELLSRPPSYAELREGKTVRRERRLLRKDGTRVRVEAVGSMVEEGKMQSVVRELPRESPGEAARVEFYEEVSRFEAGLIRRALAQTGGNQKKAAVLLGVNHTTFHTMMRRHRIDPAEFKEPPPAGGRGRGPRRQ